jgi:tetratricopeptide (TPR) repeat protein
LGDNGGLAKAWTLAADMWNGLARRGEMEEAAVRAMEHARRAGDVREEAMSARLLGGALLYGPAAVAEAIPRCEEIVRRAADSPMLEVAVLPILAQLYGMQGRFPEGRALFDRSRSLQDELALRYFSARMANQAGDFELLAGNAVAAEREQRRGCEIFREMGETGRFSTVASTLADALYTLGRYDEALSWTRESEEATSPDDLVSQVDWRRVRGKVLARRGEIARAEELVREALRIAETSIDDVHLQDKALRDNAEVLRLLGRPAEGVPYAQRALELQERKGNVAGAARASALLEKLAGGA